ncbi:MAG: peptidase MA domain-containing protein [Dehalococcoidales bacterium]|nr:peptidase MA domain-containing protein [Dehalococcoidales bacterium]
MKKVTLPFLVILLSLLLLIPGAVRADSGIIVSDISAQVNFPADITFSMTAESDVSITDIRLHYSIERASFAQVAAEVYIPFTSAKSVDAQWVWDMRRTGGLPPGATVSYWWTVTDITGKKIVTEPSPVYIEDNRYDWNTMQQGQVTLYWYEGDNLFADELMAAAQDALVRLADNTGAELENPVKMYIYASQEDLIGAMVYPQEWTGGVAYSQFGIVAIGIGTTQSQLEWGKRTIAHELTHLVIHQLTDNPYNYLPTWLDEGLAMSSEGELELSFVLALSWADANDSHISVRSLCSPFSSYVEQTMLAYAESYKIVAYLINEYGSEKMSELLDTFKQGSGYDEALIKVYGFDMDELNTLWLSE